MSYADHGFLTVLVADDDPTMRQLLSGIVLGEGHQVVSVDSAEAGLAQLPLFTFDMALLDHHLPEMEGLVFGEYLQRNNPRMVVVLVSGSPDARLPGEAEAAGVRFIAKPFEPEQLVDLLHTTVTQEDARLAASRAALSQHAAGPVRWGEHWAELGAAFGVSGCPQRLEDTLAHRTREALEAISFRGGFDERSRAIAYAGLVALRVLGASIPVTRSGTSFTAWYDQLMRDAGRPEAFGGT